MALGSFRSLGCDLRSILCVYGAFWEWSDLAIEGKVASGVQRVLNNLRMPALKGKDLQRR
jgi:hypothetical protein